MPISFPSNPQQNDEYTYNNRIYVFTGNTWSPKNVAFADVDPVEPTITGDGYLWYDSANEQFFIYVNGEWIVSGGGASIELSATAPANPTDGTLWLDTNTGIVSVYYGTAWISVSGGETDFANISGNVAASGTVKAGNPFYLNSNTVTANFTIPAGTNAMSAGPITLADDVVITVPDGSEWTVV